MRILCFIDSLGPGGAQRQLVNLGVLLHRGGHEVEFLTYGASEFFRPLLDSEGIRVTRIKNRNYAERIVRCWGHLRKCDADVVVSFLDTPNFLAALCAVVPHRWKLVTNELSALEDSFVSRRSRLMRRLQCFSDVLVCNSENARTLWVNSGLEAAERTRVIYNPVLIPAMGAVVPTPALGRRRLVVAASYQRIKNPGLLIEAIAALAPRDRERLVVDWYGNPEPFQGDTSVYEAAKRRVAELRLDTVIRLHTPTTRIYDEMRTADVVGLFSDYEGLPNAVCEAMSLGKPVIMTKVSDYWVLVDDGNGFLCGSTDVVGIQEALEAMLCASEGDLASMGRCSTERARRLFAPDSIIAQWMEVFSMIGVETL